MYEQNKQNKGNLDGGGYNSNQVDAYPSQSQVFSSDNQIPVPTADADSPDPYYEQKPVVGNQNHPIYGMPADQAKAQGSTGNQNHPIYGMPAGQAQAQFQAQAQYDAQQAQYNQNYPQQAYAQQSAQPQQVVLIPPGQIVVQQGQALPPGYFISNGQMYYSQYYAQTGIMPAGKVIVVTTQKTVVAPSRPVKSSSDDATCCAVCTAILCCCCLCLLGGNGGGGHHHHHHGGRW